MVDANPGADEGEQQEGAPGWTLPQKAYVLVGSSIRNKASGRSSRI